MSFTSIVLVIISALAGGLLAFLVQRLRTATLTERLLGKESQLVELRQLLQQTQTNLIEKESEILTLHTEITEVKTNLGHEQERSAILAALEEKFTQSFKALSHDALKSNNQSFLELAKTQLQTLHETARGDLEKRQQAIGDLVKPVRESLEKFDTKIQDIEKARVGAYEGLNQQVRSLFDLQQRLQAETGNLVKALGTPRVRGRWGEIQLRRVVELAGMVDHCDFTEQVSVNTEEGRLRPDMIIKLPGGKSVVVDAKAPLAAYLEALESPDDKSRKERLEAHARHIYDHAKQLGGKAYWEQFEHAPEFAVLFLPGEAFFGAALECRPELIEQSISNRVIIATPTTLIALLKAVSFGWRQEKLAENAAAISELGKDLYKRLADMAGNFASVGNSLGKAVESFNKTVGSLETRVLPQARRFKELEVSSGKEVEVIDQIDSVPRVFQAPELIEAIAGGALREDTNLLVPK